MRYEYIATNLCIVSQDALHNRDAGTLLQDDFNDEFVDIIEDAICTLVNCWDILADRIQLGRAKVTIELLSDLEAKSEFTPVDLEKFGKPLPVNVMENMD